MMKRLRWGILGTGNIARQFAAGAAVCRRGELAAVASRAGSSAAAFAATHGVARAYGVYQQLIDDRDVDAVYVSLPNSMHHEWTIKALEAGKHVLCEKPVATDAAEAEEMFDVARRKGLTLTEAFMYRAHPLTHAVLDAVRGGAIGRVWLVRTSFCYRTLKIDGNIRFDPKLAGGALMDIGCYCISFARLVAGQEPDAVQASGRLHASGVDEMAVGTLSFPDGILASVACGMGVQADNTAYICGTDGYVEIPVPWKPPQRQAAYTIARGTPPKMDGALATNVPARPPRETFHVDAGLDLYGVEADAVAATILDGAPPMMTAADSVGNMRVLDEMRRQVGVRFEK